MVNNSICPKCNGINSIESNMSLQHVSCSHCHHVYEHANYFHYEDHIADEKMIKLKDMIAWREYSTIGYTTTVCLLRFQNEIEITGTSTVKNKDDFNSVIGKDVAYENALKKALIFFGAIL